MEWLDEERIERMRRRCWLLIGLAIGFVIGMGFARFIDVQEFSSREVPIREEKDWGKVPEGLRSYPK